MEIHVPEEISHYEPELRFVFDLMVRKLHVNRHKGFGETTGLPQLMGAIADEHIELQHETDQGSQFAAVVEAVDVANSGLLVALKLLRMTRPEFDELKPRRD